MTNPQIATQKNMWKLTTDHNSRFGTNAKETATDTVFLG